MGLVDDFKLQFHKPNNLVIQLVLVNSVIWIGYMAISVILHMAAPEVLSIFRSFIVLPSDLNHLIIRPWTVVTYGFFHSAFDPFHIIGNMLGLYFFGRVIADIYGQNRVLSLFMLGILAGAITFVLAFNYVPYFNNLQYREGFYIQHTLIGASAGVFAIVVGAATFLPDYRFNLIFIGPVKIIYIAMFYLLFSYIGLVGKNSGGMVAHLGGALIGFVYAKMYSSGTDIGKWVIVVFDFFKGLFKPKPKVRVSYKNNTRSSSATNKSAFSRSSTSNSSGSVSQSEIDIILDKISQSGYESLTKDEKQKLFSASQKR